MAKIKVLPLHEAQKIAAGEVVERPANVIKELIENALDAGATQITVSLENGGSDFISIVDNGCGMSNEDARLCIEQFATSKISSVEELATIGTFGFRGEALASIAAVSKLTLITREASSIEGLQLEIEQGKILQESITSCNTGTTIIVRDLFYNVPARKKFLKKRDSEWRQIIQFVQAFCFDYLSVHFKVFHDQKLTLNCPPAESLMARASQLFDKRIADSLLVIEQQKDSPIHGIISNAHYYRYDRLAQFFFVNKRWVKNHTLSRALLKGYAHVLPTDRHPAACIFIEVDPITIDVNIHPRKEEVQFLHPRIIENQIQQAVQQTLEKKLSASLRAHNTPPPALKFEQEKPMRFVAASLMGPQTPLGIMPPTIRSIPESRELIQELPAVVETNENLVIEEQRAEQFTIIGHYKKTYILLEREDGIYLVDQHAAHERILYEQFTQRFGAIESVPLMFPQIIHVEAHDLALLSSTFDLLAQHGIVLEIFGEHQLVVQSIPVHAKNISMAELIKTITGWLLEYQRIEHDQLRSLINEKLHAQMACKAAIKAGDTLTTEHMHQLLKQLQSCKKRFTCPHGRPTGWLLSLNEIEKQFKRNYQD